MIEIIERGEKMKLSYSSSYNNTNLISLLSLIALLVALAILHMPLLDIKGSIHILFILLEVLIIIGIIYQIYSIKEENAIRNKEIWKNGEKYIGNIIDIGYTRKINILGRHYTIEKVPYSEHSISHDIIDYYITVQYNNSYCVDVKSIQYNKAYKILAMILNPYPIKEKIEIPIEIYVYKNKIYADLNSLDICKLKGYEECKMLIEKEI